MTIPIPVSKVLEENLIAMAKGFSANSSKRLFDYLSEHQVPEEAQAGLLAIVEYMDTHSGDFQSLIQNLSKLSSLIQIKERDPLPQTLQELLGVPNASLQQMYKIACTYFEDQKLEEASAVFSFLTLLNPFVYSFWLSLSLSFIHHKKYKKALYSLAASSILKSEEVAPHIYACECYLALGDLESGSKELESAQQAINGYFLPEWDEPLKVLKKAVLNGN